MVKVAIIGGGISGLGAAYLLHKKYDITLYEQESFVGGHSRTIAVETPSGSTQVDTGFIVFNQRNYPYLSALFRHLDVPTVKSKMSFGVTIDQGWLEYGTGSLLSLFGQKRNLLRPEFYGMLRDILFFNRKIQGFVASNPEATVQECFDGLKLGAWFQEYYLLAMCGAIWSMSASQIRGFPASTMIGFLNNHGLLSVNDQPQWHTVRGGSQEYVRRLVQPFSDCIRLNSGVRAVKRRTNGIEIHDTNGACDHYDQVIFACHSDQALKLIAEPTATEREILGSIRYQNNRVITHADTTFMPRNRQAWSSWVYLAEQGTESCLSLSYWMNNLQPLGVNAPVFVTLNPHRAPDPNLVYDTHEFAHPVFDQAAIAAQKRLEEIQGHDRIWFCGAWQGYGFHEDGLKSAVKVAENLGVPWNL